MTRSRRTPSALAVLAALTTVSSGALAQATPEPPPPQPAPAPAPPAPAPPPPGTAPAPPAPAPGHGAAPPSHYYVDPAEQPPPGAAPAPPQGPYEPPPPGYYGGPVLIYEPPPPPIPKHIAPKTAFWFGGRLGWFVPFGDLFYDCVGVDSFGRCDYDDIELNDFAAPGLALTLDVGMRFSRRYNVLFTWEHAALGKGSSDAADQDGGQVDGSTDYYAIALRMSSDPNKVGFLTEIALGYRSFHAEWENGRTLDAKGGPFEFRLGLGADIRMGPIFALSPMVNLGLGFFGEVESRDRDGNEIQPSADHDIDEPATHGWVALSLGGHFDLGGGR